MAVEIVSAKLEGLSSGGAPPSRSKIISSSHKGAISRPTWRMSGIEDPG
jgi:hypothetical protein